MIKYGVHYGDSLEYVLYFTSFFIRIPIIIIVSKIQTLKESKTNYFIFQTNEFICHFKIAGINIGGSIPTSSLKKSEFISNEKLFGSLKNDSVVIVVQVIPIPLRPTISFIYVNSIDSRKDFVFRRFTIDQSICNI